MSEDHDELLPQLRELLASGARRDWQPNATFAELVTPDADLAAIIGPGPLSRAELGKKTWEYIRANNLQNPCNKWLIDANDAVAKIVYGRYQVSAVELMRCVLEHVK